MASQGSINPRAVQAGSSLSFFERYLVGVLIEVPVMLMLVEICKRTAMWFPREPEKATLSDPHCVSPYH